jgi:hypothetical protein
MRTRLISHGGINRLIFGIVEAGRLLHVSPWVVRLEIARGNLNARRVGRRLMLSRAELDGYLARREEQALLDRIQVLPPSCASAIARRAVSSSEKCCDRARELRD